MSCMAAGMSHMRTWSPPLRLSSIGCMHHPVQCEAPPPTASSGGGARAALLGMESAAAQLEAMGTCERRLAAALRMALFEVCAPEKPKTPRF